MASHVVVIDSALRRHTVKTTPSKHLTDVIREVCSKLGLDADNYTLKHNEKPLDMSRTIGLAGLSPGAKLTLVQASRSPLPVNVALQLPPGPSGALTRLTEKFPSNTPIWQILRRFESGAAGGTAAASQNINITQRATPLMQGSAGRLCYEMPVVGVMGRELASFADLQKTLAQLGLGSGSALLRLSFRNTQQPLEEAMADISRYFHEEVPEVKESKVEAPVQPQPAADETPEPPAAPIEATAPPPAPITAPTAPTESTSTTTSTAPTALQFFTPPSATSSAPPAHDEGDYVPTVDHAKLHQARLVQATRNKRLASDAELAAAAASAAESRASVTHVSVRLRFPDQSAAQRDFGRDETVRDLYAVCRQVLRRPRDERFSVRVAGARGATEHLPESDARLVADLGWKGGVLVTVVWDGERPAGAALKEEYEALAREIPRPKEVEGPVQEEVRVNSEREDKKGGSGVDRETRMKKLLGRLSKK